VDIAQYFSCVRKIDAFVGDMLKKLEASGQADHTIVVFTVDHGIGCARGKASVYTTSRPIPGRQ
jgi:arylsulfatase A-like enzyme